MNPSSCPAELWPAFSRLIDEALDLPQNERAAWLERLPIEHDAVRPWLERLLLGEPRISEDFLDAPRLLPMVTALDALIGPYRLISELGHGGMGVVYRAERIGGVPGHRVALKVVKRGMDTDEILSRFRREREILAQLKHPNITRLIDGGASESGQAWFAMELVDGVPITQWCDAHRATPAERIALFRTVCAAVQHAHRNLVVHRDLKPSNILVDAEGQVKLLDFGIAKLLGDAAEARTQSQLKLFTPEYAAPEQSAGAAVTTATDIYQLGLVLRELLCGQRMQRNADGSAVRLAAVCARVDPARIGEIAAARGMQPVALGKVLRGDLDKIVQQALSEEPVRRYDSPAAFADDLARWSEGQPVRAAGESSRYKIAKFLRRHAAVSVLVTLLAAGLVAATALALATARSERVQRERAQAVAGFLEALFRNADPRVSLKPQTQAGDLLEAGARAAATRSDLGADAQRDLLLSIAGSMQSLGMYERAHALYAQARELASAARHDVGVAAISVSLAYNDWEWGSERHAADELERMQMLLRQDDLPALDRGLLHYAAGINASNLTQIAVAERELRSAQSEQRSLVEYDADGYATLLMLRGQALSDLGNFAAADALLRESVARFIALHGEDHAKTLRARLELLDNEMGWHHRADEAEIRTLAKRLQAMLGPAHHNTLDAWDLLGRFYLGNGRSADALDVFESLIEPSRTLFGERSYNAAVTWLNVGLGRLRLDRRADARDALGKALAAAEGLRDGEMPIALARAGLALLDCLDGDAGARARLQTLAQDASEDADGRLLPRLMLEQCRYANGDIDSMRAELPPLADALRARNGERDSDARRAADLLARIQTPPAGSTPVRR